MTIEYKIYYDGESATLEELDKIEEIVVEQEVGKVWEARLKIPVCTSDTGVWEGEDEPARSEFSRVRVEMRVGESGFVPLIDGRIIGQDAERSPIPGKSMVTLIVHDDTALLHVKDETEPHKTEQDSEIARKILNLPEFDGKPQIDKTDARPDTDRPALQQGTKMKMLRALARRNGNFYAYVLPGKEVGKSIGCFKKLPEKPDETLPTLYMFGENQNLAEFNVRHNASLASDVEASSLSLRDKTVANSVSKYRKATLLDKDAATVLSEENQTKRRLPPGHSDSTDLESATKGAMEKSSFTLNADGSVLPLCYGGVLSPYRVVPVRLSDSRYSTNYVIFKVVHTLNRSNYTQSFTMKGNAVAPKKEASASLPQPSASVAVAFNVQGRIF